MVGKVKSGENVKMKKSLLFFLPLFSLYIGSAVVGNKSI